MMGTRDEPVGVSVDQPSAEAGFTLVETLVAVVILAFGLVAVTNLFIVGASSNQVANLGTAAAAQASQTLEKLKTLDFCTLAPGGSLTADLGAANATPEVLVGGVLTYHSLRTEPPPPAVPGVGAIATRWIIVDVTSGNTPTRFITVESRVDGPFGGGLSHAQFSTFRACTSNGCPDTNC
jgi:prepilin-type N-terminal cleavage/methylation domain-containing protein